MGLGGGSIDTYGRPKEMRWKGSGEERWKIKRDEGGGWEWRQKEMRKRVEVDKWEFERFGERAG